MDVQAAQGGTGACQRRLLIAENKLNISEIIWLEDIVDKLKWKHNVDEYEVIEIFNNKPLFRFVEKGHRKDENVYAALGQTNSLFFNSSSVATNVKPGDTITFKIRKRQQRWSYGRRKCFNRVAAVICFHGSYTSFPAHHIARRQQGAQIQGTMCRPKCLQIKVTHNMQTAGFGCTPEEWEKTVVYGT